MIIVSNDLSRWSVIDSNRFYSYVAVVSFAAVIYDWALTFGREVELIWMQRWSLLTVLYLSVRYAGIPYAVMYMLGSLPSVSLTDVGCDNLFFALSWMNVVVTAILGVIMIARLHAMYQRSRKIFIFLIVTFLALTIACGATTAIGISRASGKELILSGTYQCAYNYKGDARLLMSMTWILRIVWEILTLCLAVWVNVKHFRELHRSTESIIGDCFTILMRTHIVYFTSFVAGSLIALGFFFSTISDSNSMGYNGAINILSLVQMFLLGPRLILSVREYHAKLIAESDTGTGMTSSVFQEYTYVSTWQ